jgi:hypothetical protein
MKTLIKNLLREYFKVEIKDKDIVCDNCGWSWDKKDSKKVIYTFVMNVVTTTNHLMMMIL